MFNVGNVLGAIVSVLKAVVILVVNFVTGIFQMLDMLPSAVTLLSYGISMMPPVLTVLATAFISVSVVYLIIGR